MMTRRIYLVLGVMFTWVSLFGQGCPANAFKHNNSGSSYKCLRLEQPGGFAFPATIHDAQNGVTLNLLNTTGTVAYYLRPPHNRCQGNLNVPFTGVLLINGTTCPYGQGVSLPITLVSFEGQQRSNQVHLWWQTAYEFENKEIVVERRNPGDPTWREVAVVEGRNSSDEITDYHVVDGFPESGRNLYRLKDIDFDGNFSYSEIVEVVFQPLGTVYPNPMITELNIHGPFDLLDLHGHLVASGNSTQVDVSDLAPGMYIVRQGEVVQRVVKR